MKMIWHKAIGQDITMWQHKFSDFLQKVNVVVGFKKYSLPVISPVVDMI